MRLLLDSHILLWALYEPEKLPPGIATLLEAPENKLFVSLATNWEIANKAAMYRLPLVGISIEPMLARCAELGVTTLPIRQSDFLVAARLPPYHADPFDRILVAPAQTTTSNS